MKPIVVALVGHPNSGKTTLFNALTNSHQKVGNWAGVTVEKKQGCCKNPELDKKNASFFTPLEVVDLPGCITLETSLNPLYPLNPLNTFNIPVDEQITFNYLTSGEPDVIVNVVNGTEIEQHLYVTLQLIEQFNHNKGVTKSKIPIIIAVNMMDEVAKLGMNIDCKKLEAFLKCPVIPMMATRRDNQSNLADLKQSIVESTVESTVDRSNTSNRLNKLNIHEMNEIKTNENDILEANRRHQFIKQILAACIHRASDSRKIKFANFLNFKNYTRKIDDLVLNPILAIPCFLLVMYLIFAFTIQMSGIFKNEWEGMLKFIFIDKLAAGLRDLNFPTWLIELLAQGLGQGLMTTLSFIPVITCMFFCLTLLETSGYMARVSFVMDKIMQWVGLSGQAFVPMILGFGCNVPAVLATRTLSNPRERILTIIMSPFMSCGARLAIYALFVSVFFKTGGHNIIFILYLIGILVALMTGLVLRGVFFTREKSPLIMSLPPYRWPSLRSVWRITWHQIQRFVYKAGVIIVPLCILLSSLIAFRTSDQESWLTHISKAVTPIFAPIGIEQDNWQATAGLVSGIVAKEVVVGTLNSLYAQETRHLPSAQMQEGMAMHSEEMANHFKNKASVFAYLLFVLLYFPCVSVLAAIARELTAAWAVFSVVWTTGLAYIVSVLFYQSAMIIEHPYRSLSWIASMVFLLIFGLKGMKKWVSSNLNRKDINKKGINKNRRDPVPTQLLIIN